MRRIVCFVTSLVLLVAARAGAQSPAESPGHEMHGLQEPGDSARTTSSGVRDPALPADEDHAKDALEHSPRHGEFVDIPLPQGGPLRAWVVYPERPDRAGVVLVVHEIFGLSDWIRGVADQLAREGFIAVAPDLVSGLGPNGGGTESLPSRDDVVRTIRSVTPEMATARLDAARAWALAQPSANGRLATVGFCWGGGRSFAYATTQPKLDGAVVYYGTSPDSAALRRIHAPVLGLYGGDDARVVATVAPAAKVLAAAHLKFEHHEFAGAGHGFLRQQGDRSGANFAATREGWSRTIAFLRGRLGR